MFSNNNNTTSYFNTFGSHNQQKSVSQEGRVVSKLRFSGVWTPPTVLSKFQAHGACPGGQFAKFADRLAPSRVSVSICRAPPPGYTGLTAGIISNGHMDGGRRWLGSGQGVGRVRRHVLRMTTPSLSYIVDELTPHVSRPPSTLEWVNFTIYRPRTDPLPTNTGGQNVRGGSFNPGDWSRSLCTLTITLSSNTIRLRLPFTWQVFIRPMPSRPRPAVQHNVHRLSPEPWRLRPGD